MDSSALNILSLRRRTRPVVAVVPAYGSARRILEISGLDKAISMAEAESDGLKMTEAILAPTDETTAS